MKTVQENVDYDILTKLYPPRAHWEEISELETGLVIVRANSSQQSRGLEISRWLGTENSSKEGLQTKQKDHFSLLTPTYAQFSYKVSLGWANDQGTMEDETQVKILTLPTSVISNRRTLELHGNSKWKALGPLFK